MRLWTGVGTISWDGQTWIGAGNILGLTAIEETVEVRAIRGDTRVALRVTLGAAPGQP